MRQFVNKKIEQQQRKINRIPHTHTKQKQHDDKHASDMKFKQLRCTTFPRKKNWLILKSIIRKLNKQSSGEEEKNKLQK